jgi:hypothetical protein
MLVMSNMYRNVYFGLYLAYCFYCSVVRPEFVVRVIWWAVNCSKILETLHMLYMCLYIYISVSKRFSIPSIQFFFGLPRAHFCFGIHFIAMLGNLPLAILWTWPYHISCFCSIFFFFVIIYVTYIKRQCVGCFIFCVPISPAKKLWKYREVS